MNMKITKRDQKLLMILGGLLIFLVCYMMVFRNFSDKADEAQRQINTLTPRLTQLRQYKQNLPTYEAGIETDREVIKETLKDYPSDIKEEDVLSYILKLEGDTKIDVTSVDFSGKTLLNEFTGAMDVNGGDMMTPIDIFEVSSIFTGDMTYGQLKQVIDYLYDTKKQTTLDSVSVTYNNEKKLVTAGVSVNKYCVDYEGAVYEAEQVPNAAIGTGNLFGTK